MAVEQGFDALAAIADGLEARGRENAVARAAKRVRALFHRRRIRAYRRLFLDPDGQITPDAALFLQDIASIAKLGTVDDPSLSEAELRTIAGRRATVLHIVSRLDLGGASLRKLASIIRENRDE